MTHGRPFEPLFFVCAVVAQSPMDLMARRTGSLGARAALWHSYLFLILADLRALGFLMGGSVGSNVYSFLLLISRIEY